MFQERGREDMHNVLRWVNTLAKFESLKLHNLNDFTSYALLFRPF